MRCMLQNIVKTALVAGLVFSLCHCGGGVGAASSAPASTQDTVHALTYTVGGTVTGLSGTLVLQNNAGDDLSLTVGGAFTFATALADAAAYAVTVKTNPTGQICSVASGSGTIAAANVALVIVTCTTTTTTTTTTTSPDMGTHAIGGTVSGLTGAVVLQNNGGDNVSVNANGSFTFATKIANGGAYSVTVLTNPNGQICTANTNAGAVSGSDISTVVVTCVNVINSYTVGGTITGQTGSLVLQNNSGDELTVAGNATAFTFTTKVANGAGYSVTIKTAPAGQNCLISNGSGSISSANVTTVAVSCTTPLPSDPYAIGLTASDWDVISNGEGTVTFDASGILMTPKAATVWDETHGAWLLAKTTESQLLQNFKATIKYTNVAQLRTGTAPNPWEVFWLFFNYTIGSDTKKQTNYVMIKTNGTEMGRAYSETKQEFLVTNDTPSILIETEHTITVTKNGPNVNVLLDGALAADFTSAAAPSTKYIYDVPGSIGLYTEDAQVRVSSVKIEPL